MFIPFYIQNRQEHRNLEWEVWGSNGGWERERELQLILQLKYQCAIIIADPIAYEITTPYIRYLLYLFHLIKYQINFYIINNKYIIKKNDK